MIVKNGQRLADIIRQHLKLKAGFCPITSKSRGRVHMMARRLWVMAAKEMGYTYSAIARDTGLTPVAVAKMRNTVDARTERAYMSLLSLVDIDALIGGTIRHRNPYRLYLVTTSDAVYLVYSRSERDVVEKYAGDVLGCVPYDLPPEDSNRAIIVDKLERTP